MPLGDWKVYALREKVEARWRKADQRMRAERAMVRRLDAAILRGDKESIEGIAKIVAGKKPAPSV